MSSGTSSRLPALETSAREETGRELQATLIELVDLALVGKQLHWSVIGPRFRSIHQQLDEFVASWRELSDDVAERAVAIGVWPNGQSAVIATSRLLSVDCGAIEDDLVLRRLVGALSEVAARVRERMDRLGELDAASQDVITGVARQLEEQLWMIRAQSTLSEA